MEDNGVSFMVSSSTGGLTVTADHCQCTFWSFMHLSCRHMFAVQDKMKLPIFSAVSVAERWKVSYMRDDFNRNAVTPTSESFLVGKHFCSHML